MDKNVLSLVVIAQVVVFQFVAVAFTRSLFLALLGRRDGSAPPASTAYLRRVGRFRFALGAVLLTAALVVLLGFPEDPGMRKLGLLALSLISSAAFVRASVADRRAVLGLREALPDAGVRRASLRPRSIEDWYSVVWEALPIAIVLVTVVAAIVLGSRLGSITTGMWILLVTQIAFVSGALAYTVRGRIGVPDLSRRIPGLGSSPENGVAFGARLVGLEMRYLMAAKIGVALLLGVGLVEKGLSQGGENAASWFAAASWVLVAVLLTLFTAFVAKVGVLVRKAQ